MPTVPCYHVTTARGEVYGVAATTQWDALALTSERLRSEDSDDAVRRAVRVGTWDAPYGTVLHY